MTDTAIRPTGRPSSYSDELADHICTELATGRSLRKICAEEGMPHLATVMLWVAKGSRGDERYKRFYEQYTHAREAQAEIFPDELIDIADEGNTCEPAGEDGVFDNVQRAKLRIETRKWAMSKLLPKKYGDKTQHELTGPNGGPIQTTSVPNLSNLTDDELQQAEVLAVKLAGNTASTEGDSEGEGA